MEEIKALFFDIDGTIVEFQSNRIRKEVVQAISKAHENGYKVGIASSRPLTIINDIENIMIKIKKYIKITVFQKRPYKRFLRLPKKMILRCMFAEKKPISPNGIHLPNG